MSLPKTIRHTLAQYTASALLVAAASSVRVAALAVLGTHAPDLTFYPAVMIAALYGGLGPGLMATLLSAVVETWWIPPIGHPMAAHDMADVLGMGIFVFNCSMITVVCEALRRALARVIEAQVRAKVADERRQAALTVQLEKELNLTNLRMAQDQLRESDERMRLATEATAVGIWEWNLITNQIHWDAQMFRIFGITPTHDGLVEYDTWSGSVLPEDLPRQEEVLRDTIRRLGRGVREFRIRRPGETECRHIQTAETVRTNGRGEAEWVVGTSLDVTEQKHAEDALKAAKSSAEHAKADAEAANKAKDHFLAVLSHELRTPLTPVLTLAQMMEQDESHSPRVRESAEIIRRNVELEARLIDDLLDLTRISRGKLELHLRTADVHKKLQQVIQICDGDLRSKQLHLVSSFDAPAHYVRADGARLQQIFWNLLRNAVKFTPTGGTITLRTANCEHGGLSIQVEDNGIGMDSSVLPRIFNAFEQAGPETTRVYGGLGLGLSISKALVERHGGTLTASSAGKGHGATFTVVLPNATQISDGPQKVSPQDVGLSHAERAALMNYRILLVEDHPDSARAMSRVLKSLGYQVRNANCVAAALQSAGAENFDLVISDIGLPDGSGLDLMRQLRLKGLTKGIAVSGFGMEEDIVRSRDAGFVEHLTKPVNMQQFETVVARVLQTSDESRQTPVDNESLA